MTRIYKIEFHRGVPVIEMDGEKWLFDTGCPISWPDPRVLISQSTQDFLGVAGLRMLGRDKMSEYVYVDFSGGIIAMSDAPIELEGGTAIPLEANPENDIRVQIAFGWDLQSMVLDTGSAVSYVNPGPFPLDNFPCGDDAEDNDLMGRTWTTSTRVVPVCLPEGRCFDMRIGEYNPNPLPPGGVAGVDFFNAYRVLFHLRPTGGGALRFWDVVPNL